MNINKFAEKVCEQEGKAKQMSISQVKEVLRVVNKLTCGLFYAMIRMIP